MQSQNRGARALEKTPDTTKELMLYMAQTQHCPRPEDREEPGGCNSSMPYLKCEAMKWWWAELRLPFPLLVSSTSRRISQRQAILISLGILFCNHSHFFDYALYKNTCCRFIINSVCTDPCEFLYFLTLMRGVAKLFLMHKRSPSTALCNCRRSAQARSC